MYAHVKVPWIEICFLKLRKSSFLLCRSLPRAPWNYFVTPRTGITSEVGEWGSSGQARKDHRKA